MSSIELTHLTLLTLVLTAGPRASYAQTQSGSNDNDRVRVLLSEALEQKLKASVFPVRFDQSSIKIRSETSAAVPDLMYSWGTFRPMDISHGYVFAVVAKRGSTVRVVRTAADWGLIAHGWQPGSADQARRACLELVRAVGRGADPELPAIPIRDAQGEINAMSPDLQRRAARALTEPDTILAPTDGEARWTVEMWVFETGATSRYRCVFDQNRETADIEMLQTIHGVGWFRGSD